MVGRYGLRMAEYTNETRAQRRSSLVVLVAVLLGWVLFLPLAVAMGYLSAPVAGVTLAATLLFWAATRRFH